MKVWVLIDDQNIVRCLASELENLHPAKVEAGMLPLQVECGGTVGDEYRDGVWTRHPENYPQPNAEEVREGKIAAEMRAMAIERLEARGELNDATPV